MSVSAFPPPGAIRSIQRGTITITTGNTSATATISSVNTARSVLSFLGTHPTTGATDDTRNLVKVELTNATTVTATTFNGVGDKVVNYQVVEYY